MNAITKTRRSIAYDILPEELHGQGVINVLAGGPSVKPYLGRLQELDGPWIGACRAGLLQKSQVTISCDKRFARQCPEEIKAALDAGRYVLQPVRPNTTPDHIQHLDARTKILSWRPANLSKVDHELGGFDSGFACFNAALIYQPRKIRLFGFDYNAPAGQERFHDGYPGNPNPRYDRSLEDWVRAYERHSQEIQAFGVEIEFYVGSPPSRIRTLLRYKLQDLFA